MVKYRRIKPERIKKYLVSIGAISLPLAMGLFIYLSSINAITILDFSNDTICAGTLEDPCIAELAFHANTNNYIYPNETWLFSTDKKLKILKLQRSWGNSWRTIYLNQTWNSKVKYAIKFSKGKDYKIRFVAEKINPYEDVCWEFGTKQDSYYIDPVFKGIKLNYNVTNLKNSKAIKLNLLQDYNLSNLAKLQGKKSSDYLNLKKTKYFGDVDVRLMEKVNVTKERVKRTYDCNCTNETYNFTDNQTNKTIKKIREVCKTCREYKNYTQEISREIEPENYILSKNKPIYELKKNGLKIVDLPNGEFGYAVWTDIFVLGQKLENCSWFNSSWSYRQPINISNTAGDLTNYQVKIELNSTNVGANFDWSDNSSIRFTNSTDDLLDYWIESWNSTADTSTIWVNVTSLTNNTNTTIYMYYGNSGASSESNYSQTMTKDSNITNLISDYGFELGSGTTVADYINGNNGTFVNTPEWQGSDGGGWAGENYIFDTGDHLHFTRADIDYINVPDDNSLDFGTGDFSVSFWLKIDDTSLHRILGKDSYAGGDYIGWFFQYDDNNNVLQFATRNSPAGQGNYLSSTDTFTDTSHWHHIIGVRSSNIIYLYIDNVSEGSLSESSATNVDNSVGLRFGCMDQSPGSTTNLNGYLDEIKLYNKALNAGEREALFQRRKYASPEPTVSIGSEEANIIGEFTIVLNSPDNQTITTDNTTDHIFNVSGNKATYYCSLYYNDTIKGTNTTTANNTLTTITSSEVPNGFYEWYVNCTAGGVTNQSEIREITIGKTISGYVKDTSGTGINGARVNIIKQETSGEDTLIATVSTNASGYYSYTTNQPGDYTICAYINDTTQGDCKPFVEVS